MSCRGTYLLIRVVVYTNEADNAQKKIMTLITQWPTEVCLFYLYHENVFVQKITWTEVSQNSENIYTALKKSINVVRPSIIAPTSEEKLGRMQKSWQCQNNQGCRWSLVVQFVFGNKNSRISAWVKQFLCRLVFLIFCRSVLLLSELKRPNLMLVFRFWRLN